MSGGEGPGEAGAAGGAGATAGVPPPPGYVRLTLGDDPFVQSIGPLYGRADEAREKRLVLGLRVERRHCNPAGFCHGGMLMSMADMLLVIGSNLQAGLDRFTSTVSLSADFLAPVPQGAWLEGRLEVLRATRNLVFCQGIYRVDGAPVMRLDGIVKPVGEPSAEFSGRRWFA
ncbi:MAG TPA: PaaI family thioesterase [Burkholderiaceae bacterium]|nr:PaaI family thioesterase [Burkholderiaceae bacterium]